MKDYITINLKGDSPIVATAIHDGHLLSEYLEGLSALDEADRLREEDPYTGAWTSVSDNRIIAHHSRFEFDLNRPPDKAIYLTPADAWGLHVWKSRPSAKSLEQTMLRYHGIYNMIHKGLEMLLKKFDSLVIFDLHSYNHRRNGPTEEPEHPDLNPEINIGTGTMNRDLWAPVVDRFMDDLSSFNLFNRHLDVRENVKFKGGYFPRWIHEKFPDSVCCISIEAKKFFMDEWTGEPDQAMISALGDALKSTVPGVLEELSKPRSKN